MESIQGGLVVDQVPYAGKYPPLKVDHFQLPPVRRAESRDVESRSCDVESRSCDVESRGHVIWKAGHEI